MAETEIPCSCVCTITDDEGVYLRHGFVFLWTQKEVKSRFPITWMGLLASKLLNENTHFPQSWDRGDVTLRTEKASLSVMRLVLWISQEKESKLKTFLTPWQFLLLCNMPFEVILNVMCKKTYLSPLLWSLAPPDCSQWDLILLVQSKEWVCEMVSVGKASD